MAHSWTDGLITAAALLLLAIFLPTPAERARRKKRKGS